MGIPRVMWGMSAAVWSVVLVMCCVMWDLPAAVLAIVVGALPLLPLIGGFDAAGRVKPGRVPVYNALNGILGPIAVLIIGAIVLFTTGGFESGFWPVVVIGLAWFIHTAAGRAFGYGPRLADGTLPKREPTF